MVIEVGKAAKIFFADLFAKSHTYMAQQSTEIRSISRPGGNSVMHHILYANVVIIGRGDIEMQLQKRID